MIGLVTKGMLQYPMRKYIPSDFTIDGIIYDVLNGTIESLISGKIEDAENGLISANIQDVSIDDKLTSTIQ